MIAAGIPEGSVRAAGQRQWIEDCRARPALAHLRSDAWESLLSIARSLVNWTDWHLGTTRPTWAALMTETGLSRRTVARYLALLRTAGLLGVVATGRTAAATPMALDDGINAAAVYVLCAPHALQLVAADRQPEQPAAGQKHRQAEGSDPAPAPTSTHHAVDGHGTPSTSRLVTWKDKPTHAREQNVHELASSPCKRLGDLTRAELIAASHQLWDLGKNPLGTELGASSARTSPARRSRLARLQAAAELVRRDPVLGRLSVRHVAAICLEWHLAGYTPLDIRQALHRRPDGTPWPHDLTVAAIAHVPGWIRYRLAAWRQDPQDPTSPPATSPSRRIQAEHTRDRARAQALAERDAAVRAARIDPPPAMAAAKALLAERRLTRKHQSSKIR